jgi:outer membrane protein
MNIPKKFFFLLFFIFLLISAGCVSYNSPPSVVYSDNYSATNLNDNKELSPADKDLSKDEVITTALENNPGYKASQLEATAAEAEYYKALSRFSPDMALGPAGAAAGYQGYSGFSSLMHALSADANAKAAKWDVKNYRRLLVQKVVVDDNILQKKLTDINIQKSNEKFQKQMVSKTTAKYKKGKASLSDVLNFKINALKAKAEAIKYEKEYKKGSYALAATMGMTNAELPYKPIAKKINKHVRKVKIPNLNTYLDLAIENRPDLKAHKEILRSSEYKLYAAWGILSPVIDLTSGNNQFASASSNITGGSKIANVRSHEAKYDAENEALKKKWIEIVKEVRSEYISIKANLAIRDAYAASMNAARVRRDHLQKEYNKGNINIAVLNQAQELFVKVQKAFVKAEVGVSNARAKLCAACGIDVDESKRPSIATLNQAQRDYINISEDHAEAVINTSDAKAKLNAAIGVSDY